MRAAAAEHPEAGRIELWFADEARVGQKGRVTHTWYARGLRPRGLREHRFASAHLFGAVCPERDTGIALVLPEVSTAAMGLFLAELGRTLPIGTHAVLVLDRAGWHISADLQVPDNVTLIHLPPYSPELNPVENVWLYLRERWLSHRVLAGGYEAVVNAACAAWNALRAEPGRLGSLTSYPWLPGPCRLCEAGISRPRRSIGDARHPRPWDHPRHPPPVIPPAIGAACPSLTRARPIPIP